MRLLPKKKVSSTDLGFSVDKRLIVGENLSALNHEIFIAASNMKREQKLAQVFTINGLVNVKLQKGGKSYEIRHMQQLETLTCNVPSSNNIGHNNSHKTATPAAGPNGQSDRNSSNNNNATSETNNIATSSATHGAATAVDFNATQTNGDGSNISNGKNNTTNVTQQATSPMDQ